MTHPDTKFGLAGPLQGLNTGVVLFRLDRMRTDARFTSQVWPSIRESPPGELQGNEETVRLLQDDLLHRRPGEEGAWRPKIVKS